MALYKKDREIGFVHLGERAISAVFYSANAVWQAVRSCFGSGSWRNDKPWINNEGWKNN